MIFNSDFESQTKSRERLSDQIPSKGPPYWGREAELHAVLEKVLVNSNVKRGDKVVLFTDTRKDLNITKGFFSAAINLGLSTQILIITPLEVRADPPAHVVEFLKRADLVVNLLTTEWLYQESCSTVMKGGARILMCVESLEVLLKLPRMNS